MSTFIDLMSTFTVSLVKKCYDLNFMLDFIEGVIRPSVEYRLHIKRGTHVRGTHAKRRINNQSLITGFSVTIPSAGDEPS